MVVSAAVAVINPDDLRNMDGTLRTALTLWSCRNGPVPYNTWQSIFFALLRRADIDDDEAPDGESASMRQARIQAMHREIQRQMHGPDHIAAGYLNAAAGEGSARGAPEEERTGIRTALRTFPRPITLPGAERDVLTGGIPGAPREDKENCHIC